MMNATALQAIATLTGEQPHPCKRDGVVYAVSLHWTVWWSKDDWHSVYRPMCRHKRSPSLQDAVSRGGDGLWWHDVALVATLDLAALRLHAEMCGYTVVDLSVRLGYSPSNQEVRRILSGNRPVTVQFAQRAVAAFGRGVLGGEK